ncbi:MAG: ABC transporter ATP-binding protein [Phycisphaerae bacterium]|nr:ABC transporter ATP-binding protein [Phycisphaerae bacterium]
MSETNSNLPAIDVHGLVKRFRKHKAVDGLSMTIPPGTAFGFLGPNGAGKTTTLKLLMGLLRRDAGDVSVLGLDPAVDDVGVKLRVGYVPEQQFIYRWMRVSDAIRFCKPLYPTWNDDRGNELLKLFALDAGKKVKHLSKGNVVKLALLLAMAHEPELLILDEPMAGLDPLVRDDLLDGVLRTLCDRERTLVFSSHTMADVQRMADRIGIIDEGTLLYDGPIDVLLNGTKRIRAVLANGSNGGEPPDGTICHRVVDREWLITVRDFSQDKVSRLVAGGGVSRVDVLDLNLEEIFKDYIRGRRGGRTETASSSMTYGEVRS